MTFHEFLDRAAMAAYVAVFGMLFAGVALMLVREVRALAAWDRDLKKRRAAFEKRLAERDAQRKKA